jgi:hypothetical protein
MNSSGSSSGDPRDARVWERGWEEHEQLQLERLARLSMAEKLAWLDEAHRIVRHMESQRRQNNSGTTAV